MKLFKATNKKRSNWSRRFAWLPTKVEHNYKHYPESVGNQHVYEYNVTEHWWIWLEFYKRYFNYGAHVNYYMTRDEVKYARKHGGI